MNCKKCKIDCICKSGEKNEVFVLPLPREMTVEEILESFEKGIKKEKISANLIDKRDTLYGGGDSTNYFEIQIYFDYRKKDQEKQGLCGAYTTKVEMRMDDFESKNQIYDILVAEVEPVNGGCGLDIVKKIIKKYFK